MIQPSAPLGPDDAGADANGAVAAGAPAGGKKRRPAPPKRKSILGHIFSLPGLAVAFLGACAMIYGFWNDIRGVFVGPKLELSLTECSPGKISLSVQNSGGRAAVVSAPVFHRYRGGAEEELPMTQFVGHETFQDNSHARIEPNAGYVLAYPSSDDVPFFLPEWWRGRSCPIRAQMTLHAGAGPGEPIEADCPCAQSR